MFRKTIIIAGLSILLIVALLIITAQNLPALADQKTKKILHMAGIDTSFIHTPYKKWGKIIYQDISLDKDNFSTIQGITIEYNPLSLLFLGRLDAITIDEPNFTGEWTNDPISTISFSGWKVPDDASFAAHLPVKKISLHKARISFLTPNMGGISLSLDLEGLFKGPKLEIKARLASNQKNFSMSANADGVIARDYTDLEMEIDQGKFEMPGDYIKASRIHGWVNYTKNLSGNENILSELRAGGMTTLDLPWQNIATTIEAKDGTIRLISKAKSTGIETVNLDLKVQKEDRKTALVYGTMSAEKGKNIVAYLKEEKKFALPKSDLGLIKNTDQVQVDYNIEDLEKEKKKIRYKISGDKIKTSLTGETYFQ